MHALSPIYFCTRLPTAHLHKLGDGCVHCPPFTLFICLPTGRPHKLGEGSVHCAHMYFIISLFKGKPHELGDGEVHCPPSILSFVYQQITHIAGGWVHASYPIYFCMSCIPTDNQHKLGDAHVYCPHLLFHLLFIIIIYQQESQISWGLGMCIIPCLLPT